MILKITIIHSMKGKNMKALFIGGTGRISSACVRQALEKNWEITIITRGLRDSEFGDKVKYIKANINDTQEVKEQLGENKYDTVANFIAFSPADVERDYELFKNITNQYILISTCAVYDKSFARVYTTESTAKSNIGWGYPANKIKCEQFLYQKYMENNFPITIVRPSQVYDKTYLPTSVSNGTMTDFYTLIHRIKNDKPVMVHGDGTSIWSLTHADDFAKGFVGLMGNRHAIGEDYHITTDELLTWDQITQEVAIALGKPVKIAHIPSDYIVQEKPEWDGAYLCDKTHCNLFDNSKIKQAVPTFVATISYREGIRQTVEYIESNKDMQILDEDFERWCDDVINRFYK